MISLPSAPADEYGCFDVGEGGFYLPQASTRGAP
jgi:hypothetical protein